MGKVLTWIIPEDDYQAQGAEAPALFLDAVTAFTPTRTSRVTQYATSDKKTFSNNRVDQNDVLQITGRVSSRPLTQYVNNIVGYDELTSRKSTAYSLLKGWKESGRYLTVVDEFDVFRNCIITSLEMITEGSDSLTVNITLESVRRVSYNKVTIVQYMSDPKTVDASSTKNGGTSKTTTDVEEDEGSFSRTSKTWDILIE